MDGAANYALVIGIDDYRDGIPPLHNAGADAEAIAARLADHPHDFDVMLLRDEAATVEGVERFFAEQIPVGVSPDSSVVVYFAGHGVAEDEVGGNGPQGYLLLHDAKLDDRASWMRMDRLRGVMQERVADCRHVLVVLDCCHAGSFRWATATRDVALVRRPLYRSQYDRYRTTPAWQALTSAAAGEKAADGVGFADRRGTDERGHSPFASAFLDGLAGGADSSTSDFEPDGVITATEMYLYVKNRLSADSGDRPGQTPGIWPLEPTKSGEFVFRNPKVDVDLADDPVLDDANNPWKGLAPYTAADAALFFGRTDAVAQLAARVTNAGPGGLVGVVGPSGAGKTSLVEAGLKAALPVPPPPEEPGTAASKRPTKPGVSEPDAGPPWHIVTCGRILDGPATQLEAARAAIASAPPGLRRLLVIDQMDELFAPTVGDGERARFAAMLTELLEAPDGPVVLLIVRSDFEARLSAILPKGRWSASRWSVPPLDGVQLRQVIEGPAHVKAMFFDPAALVDQLVDEVSGMPGALPMLSFALAQLYRQAQQRRLTTDEFDRGVQQVDVDAIGGVGGLLNKTASDKYEAAPLPERRMIERIFLRLVSQQGSSLTRRRVDESELDFGFTEADRAAVKAAKDRYVEAGLLVIDGSYVEPAHSALVREWEMLHEWMARSDTQELFRSAWYAATAWKAEGADKASPLLWHANPRLPQLTEYAEELNATEREFQMASRKRRRSQRRRVLAVWATVIVALAAATLVANVQRVNANAAARRSEARALAAASGSQAAVDPALGMLLATEAHAIDPSPVSEAALMQSMVLPRLPEDRFNAVAVGDGGEVFGYALSPDGTIAGVLQDRQVAFVDTTRGLSVIGTTEVAGPRRVIFAAGARRAFVFAFPNPSWEVTRVEVPVEPAERLDARVRTAALDLVGLDAPFEPRVAVSEDGRYVAIGAADDRVSLLDFDSDASAVERRIPGGGVTELVLSRDARRLAVVAADAVHVLSVPTLEPIVEVPLTEGQPSVNVALTADGSRLVTVEDVNTESNNRWVTLWSLAGSAPAVLGDAVLYVEQLQPNTSAWWETLVSAPDRDDVVAFSPDGSTIVVSGTETALLSLRGEALDVDQLFFDSRFSGFDASGDRFVGVGQFGASVASQTVDGLVDGREVVYELAADGSQNATVGWTNEGRFVSAGDRELIVTAGDRLLTWAPGSSTPLRSDDVSADLVRLDGVIDGSTIVGVGVEPIKIDARGGSAVTLSPTADVGTPPGPGDVPVLLEPSDDRGPQLWMIRQDGSVTVEPVGAADFVFPVAASHDRHLLALHEVVSIAPAGPDELPSDESSLVVYDLTASRPTEVYRFTLPPSEAAVASFVDAEILLVATGGSVKAVRLGDGHVTELAVLDPGAYVTALSVGPTGVVVVGTADGEVASIQPDAFDRLLSGDGGAEAAGVAVEPHPSHTARLSGIWFSPDGRRIVTEDFNGVLHLVDIASGTLLLEVRRPFATTGLALTDDALFVPTIGSVVHYDLTTDTLVERACAAAGRALTEVEREQYLDGGEPRSPCGQ